MGRAEGPEGAQGPKASPAGTGEPWGSPLSRSVPPSCCSYPGFERILDPEPAFLTWSWARSSLSDTRPSGAGSLQWDKEGPEGRACWRTAPSAQPPPPAREAAGDPVVAEGTVYRASSLGSLPARPPWGLLDPG